MRVTKYYFETGEKCNYLEQDSEIGSPNCMECEFFSGVDFCESWVKCDIYSAFAEVEKLTEENKQLEKQYNMVKNICNEYLEKIKKQNKRIVHLETQIKKGAA